RRHGSAEDACWGDCGDEKTCEPEHRITFIGAASENLERSVTSSRLDRRRRGARSAALALALELAALLAVHRRGRLLVLQRRVHHGLPLCRGQLRHHL